MATLARIAPASPLFTVVLGVLAALPALSIDISAPTLQLLPAALDTSPLIAGLTLSFFMGGFALGQLAGGRLSDRHGRRPVLLVGLLSYTLAAVACGLSVSGPALVLARLVQGTGAGACSVLSFAMIQDLFQGEAARNKRSYVAVVFGIAPILAPALGSLLSEQIGWRAVHGTLAVAGLAMLGVVWLGIAESRPPGSNRADPRPGLAADRLRDDRKFVALALANALSYGSIFAYIAGAPVVVIGQMGLPSAVFAGLFACTAGALAAGAWISGRLGQRGYDAPGLLRVSLAASAVAGLAFALASAGDVNGLAFVPFLLVVLFARGITAPNLQHLAIERRRSQAGVASAAVGVSQLVAGALTSAVVAALLPWIGTGAVAVPMAVLSGAALLAWRRAERL